MSNLRASPVDLLPKLPASALRGIPTRSLGPQTITRNGRKAAVIVADDEWERKTHRKGNLADFFASSPLRRSGLKIDRLRGGVRKAGL